MTTIADIALKFGGRVKMKAPTRRCLGHANRKTHRAPQDQFGGYQRKSGRYEYYARCMECKPEYVKQDRNKSDEGNWKQARLKHTGPKPASYEYLFYRKLPPTPLAVEIRAGLVV